MQFELVRERKLENKTIGKLCINGKRFCDTLEDTDRMLEYDMPRQEILKRKVKKKTCIPTGFYKVVSYWWSKYNRTYPLLCMVPRFSGILIHSGVDENDTEGCILVGRYNEEKGVLEDGFTIMAAIRKLMNQAWKNEEYISIDVTRLYD